MSEDNIQFLESSSYKKGRYAEVLLTEIVLPEIYKKKIQYLAPQEQHPCDFMFNEGNVVFGGECKCTSMLEKYHAYAIKAEQHDKYVTLLKSLPYFTMFFVDPYIASIFVAPMKEIVKHCVKIKTVNGHMMKYDIKDMWKLDYTMTQAECNALLEFDKEMKIYGYSKNTNPECKGILDRDMGFIIFT